MRPPNLLFIFTDEQRADTMAAYGNTRIHTPNLNRLAGTSTVFDHAYVTQPVCTPSRSARRMCRPG
ncbi:MAG: sulfatase-like hydrolase/transferase [Chitinivibrionales bacterium]|nr:sulfatase-like hydrolase/transferase [Chitinivibrionales bacterium]